MSLNQKPYYILTNRQTFLRYLIDNSTPIPHRYIFYPKKYQTMTTKSITKYQNKLTLKFLKWALFNKQKMIPNDYQICNSKIIDGVGLIVVTLLLAKFTRMALFKYQFMYLQHIMYHYNLDIKFWKALTAYTISFGVGYHFFNKLVRQTDFIDLAIQYSPNFVQQQLDVPEIKNVLEKFYQTRFPWLRGGNSQGKN